MLPPYAVSHSEYCGCHRQPAGCRLSCTCCEVVLRVPSDTSAATALQL